MISLRGILEDILEPSIPVHRVAVRALAFNLRYFVDRLQAGR